MGEEETHTADAMRPRVGASSPDEPGLEPPDSTDPDVSDTELQRDLLRSLVESADYVDARGPLPARSDRALQLATPEAIRTAFAEAWEGLSHSLGIPIEPEDALAGIKDLVLYDIPDGTRSTLSIATSTDAAADAGLFCLDLVHTLASLGARKAVILIHTKYNRKRGPDDTERFLTAMRRGIEPFSGYARRHGIAIRMTGVHEGYELGEILAKAFPIAMESRFEAHFLVDYEEEWFLTPGGRKALESLPDIDVVVRHTKLQVSGGWIPIRMRGSAYMYSQNGSLHSNWASEEYATMIAVAYLAKLLHRGEALTKTYLAVDEIKDRFRRRELELTQRVVRLRPKPRKLFVVGSPEGLIQVYA